MIINYVIDMIIWKKVISELINTPELCESLASYSNKSIYIKHFISNKTPLNVMHERKHFLWMLNNYSIVYPTSLACQSKNFAGDFFAFNSAISNEYILNNIINFGKKQENLCNLNNIDINIFECKTSRILHPLKFNDLNSIYKKINLSIPLNFNKSILIDIEFNKFNMVLPEYMIDISKFKYTDLDIDSIEKKLDYHEYMMKCDKQKFLIRDGINELSKSR